MLFTEINVFVNFYNKKSWKCVYHKIAHLFLVFPVFSQNKIVRSSSSKVVHIRTFYFHQTLFSRFILILITNRYNSVRRGTLLKSLSSVSFLQNFLSKTFFRLQIKPNLLEVSLVFLSENHLPHKYWSLVASSTILLLVFSITKSVSPTVNSYRYKTKYLNIQNHQC